MSLALPRAESLEPHRFAQGPWLALAACFAVVLPTTIAYNVAPSATFFNQAAAFIGWGAFLIVLSTTLGRDEWPRSKASLALLAALSLLLLAALGSAAFAGRPWTLSLSEAGTILSAMLVVAVAAALARAGQTRSAFRAFCIALLVAGIFSSAVGLVQVFAPTLLDGEWIAASSMAGRATGNLRQPNHLSSLLLWSVVGTVWLGEEKTIHRWAALLLAVVFVYVVVLTGSRTGALSTLMLAGWGVLDRRLSRRARVFLLVTPLLYVGMWWLTSEWAAHAGQVFGRRTGFAGNAEVDFSSFRLAIWKNTLSLIATHPWLGVGFGEFNFAWTLTPFPDRPLEFFDHSHDIVLNFLAELGIPLGLVVLGLMVFALWRALRHSIADGREPAVDAASRSMPVQRAALVIVLLVTAHSLLEYPLWYSYFLLPAAFAFGLCLERPDAEEAGRARASEPNVTRPFVLASMFLVLGGSLAFYDYMRVVVIFAPEPTSPLEKRIADGQRSILFGHHADYAQGTVLEHPGKAIDTFRRSTHFLLDARLMMAWAIALNEVGETDKARYVAQRLKEFHNPQATDFFAPCAAATRPLPFQCLQPTRPLTFENFR